MNFVLLDHPYVLMLYILSIGCTLWNYHKEKHWLLHLISSLLAALSLIAAFFAGASLQEMLVAVLVLLLFSADFNGGEKKHEL